MLRQGCCVISSKKRSGCDQLPRHPRGTTGRSHGSGALLRSRAQKSIRQTSWFGIASPDNCPSPDNLLRGRPVQLQHSSPKRNRRLARSHIVSVSSLLPLVVLILCLRKACLFCGIAVPFRSLVGIGLGFVLSFSC